MLCQLQHLEKAVKKGNGNMAFELEWPPGMVAKSSIKGVLKKENSLLYKDINPQY